MRTVAVVDGFQMNSGTHQSEIVVGPGQVVDGKQLATCPGSTLSLNSGIALNGHDDTPDEGGWTYIWLIQHKWASTKVSLVRSSSPVQPLLVSKCFKNISRWWLVGVWPIGMEGTLLEGWFRFRAPQRLRITDGPVAIPVPGITIRELIEILVIDRSGHGLSVFDGDLVEVPDPPVGQLHTPSNGIGGGPPVVAKGTLVAVEGRIYCVLDLAKSGRARADLYLCGVHL